jgi:hypothetical protein
VGTHCSHKSEGSVETAKLHASTSDVVLPCSRWSHPGLKSSGTMASPQTQTSEQSGAKRVVTRGGVCVYVCVCVTE